MQNHANIFSGNEAPANTGSDTTALPADVIDTVANAARTLSGIADALSYRTAVYRDDMLDMIAEIAELQASEIREFVDFE